MKKFMLPLLALLTIGLTAFSSFKEKQTTALTSVYWIFNGNPNSPSDIADPTKYSLAPGGQQTCTTGSELCNVFAEPQSGDPNHPDLGTEDQSMRTYKN